MGQGSSLNCANGSQGSTMEKQQWMPLMQTISEVSGDNQVYQLNKTAVLTERQALEDVNKHIFKKYGKGDPSQTVHIPRTVFDHWGCVIEKILTKSSSKEFEGTTEDIKKPAGAEQKTWFIAHLFNTSNVTPARNFVSELEDDLKKLAIETRVLTSTAEMSNLETVLIIVCNKSDNETAKQAVDNSLNDIESIHYKRIILIVLHVTRKLPRTSTRDKLKCGDGLGKYSEIGSIIDMGYLPKEGIYKCDTNDDALREVNLFCSNYYAAKRGQHKANAETSMQSTNASSSEAKNVDQPLSFCEEVKGNKEILTPTAYIINPSGTPAAKKFVCEFQEKMRAYNIEISETPVSEANKLGAEAVVILVCNITSRTETDIDTSLNTINEKRYSRTILIILHVVNAGQNRRNSQRKKFKPSSEKYTDILGMIDMSFTSEKGIYDCEMNTTALKELNEIYDKLTTETKETEAKRGIVEDISDQPLDQSQASNNAIPTKKTKTGIEQEAVEKRPDEQTLNVLEAYYG